MAYGRLSTQELDGAIEQTREAIRRGQELLEIGSGEPATKGLEKLADSMPSLIEKLRDDLAKLEKARDKGAEDKTDDENEDEADEDEDEDEEDEGDEDDDEEEDED